MKNIEQLEIGGVFEVDGVEYEVVEIETGCDGCCFENQKYDCTYILNRPHCHYAIREDGKDVVFIKAK